MSTERRIVGRYELHRAIASGGMATVHLGRLRGQVGFSRIVAIKRLHAGFSETPMLVSTLLDEARLASRIQHPNVVATLDMVAEDDELLLVLEYVHGDSLSRLLRLSPEPPSAAVVASIMAGVLHGLHAAHEATGENGEPLGLVHRDVSPQNVLVGVDGLSRVLDFGVAKARGRMQTTREGQVKGKLAYMAPEQIKSGEVTRRSDVFAAGIVMWEALTGARLFRGDNEGQVLHNVLQADVEPPSARRPGLPAACDDIVMRALSRDPDERWDSARAMALAIETELKLAPASEVGSWVAQVAAEALDERAALVAALERGEDLETKPTTDAEAVTRTATVQRDDADVGASKSEVTEAAIGVALDRDGTRRSSAGRWLLLASLLAAVTLAVFVVRGFASGDPTPTPASAEASAGEVSVEVVTTPPGAMVRVLGRERGPTPVTLSLPVGSEPIELTVIRDGFVPLTRRVQPDKAQRLELTLSSTAAVSSASASAAEKLGGPPLRGVPARAPVAKPTTSPSATPSATTPFYRFE